MTNLTITKDLELLNHDINTQLEKTMFSIFENKCNEYDNLEEVINAYYNNEFTCINGNISDLIYYYQTRIIFKENFEEIFDKINEFKEEYKIEVDNNYNSMVWLTFELMVNDWIYQIESLIENSNNELDLDGFIREE